MAGISDPVGFLKRVKAQALGCTQPHGPTAVAERTLRDSVSVFVRAAWTASASSEAGNSVSCGLGGPGSQLDIHVFLIFLESIMRMTTRGKQGNLCSLKGWRFPRTILPSLPFSEAAQLIAHNCADCACTWHLVLGFLAQLPQLPQLPQLLQLQLHDFMM